MPVSAAAQLDIVIAASFIVTSPVADQVVVVTYRVAPVDGSSTGDIDRTDFRSYSRGPALMVRHLVEASLPAVSVELNGSWSSCAGTGPDSINFNPSLLRINSVPSKKTI